MESESDPLTRRAVDLFEKEPLKGNSEVHLHTPTKFGEDRSKDLGGDREQTDRQTNRQTDKRCSIYSMMSICIHSTCPSACTNTHVLMLNSLAIVPHVLYRLELMLIHPSECQLAIQWSHTERNKDEKDHDVNSAVIHAKLHQSIHIQEIKNRNLISIWS